MTSFPHKPLDTRQLQCFVRTAERLNFNRAAEDLGISQSALSQHIMSLEKQVGLHLLERNKRNVELTDVGRIFLAEAYQVVRQAERARTIAEMAANGSLGHLRLAYAGSVLPTGIVTTSVHRFRELNPDVSVAFEEENFETQLRDLTSGWLDIGFVRLPFLEADIPLTCVQLFEEPLFVALRSDHKLAHLTRIDVGELRHEKIATSYTNRNAGISWQFLEACRAKGFEPTYSGQVRYYLTIMGMVDAGYGVAITPQSATGFQFSNILYKPLDGIAPSTVAMVYRTDDLSAVGRNFVDTVTAGRQVLEL
jgi:DNA-binding transcriptional LysR family regulator